MSQGYGSKFLIVTLALVFSLANGGRLAGQTEFLGQESYPYFLHAQKVAVLSTAMNGLVDEIRHRPQDYVRKGDLLVQLDADLVGLEIESLRAKIEMSTVGEEARISLAYAEDNLEIVEKLRAITIGESHPASLKELKEAIQSRDLRQQGLIKAQLEEKLLEIELKVRQKQLELHSIVAPMDGVIVPFSSVKNLEAQNLKPIEVGEMVTVSQSVTAMMKVDRLRVEKIESAEMVDQVRLDQPANVYIQGAGPEAIPARVVYKSPTIETVGGFKIEVEFDNSILPDDDYPAGGYPYRFRPGMRARVELVMEGQEQEADKAPSEMGGL